MDALPDRLNVKRRLLNLLTTLSLLLFMAVCVLWVRSYWAFEQVRYGRVPFAVSVNSQQGRCKAEWTTEWPGLSYGLVTQHNPLRPTHRSAGSGYFLRDCTVRVGSFGCGRKAWPVGSPPAGTPTLFTIVTAPHWALALVTAALPAVSLFRWYRSRRRPRAGLCTTCGYDLRATPDKCPECGTPRPLEGMPVASAR